jgi:hypothetical protein
MTLAAAVRVAAIGPLAGADRGTPFSTICFSRGNATGTVKVDGDAH